MTSVVHRASGIRPAFTIADRLRKAREISGMGQVELAGMIDVARNTVANYERGATRPKRYIVREWAVVTGVDFDWLMGDDGPLLPQVDSNHQPADYQLALAA